MSASGWPASGAGLLEGAGAPVDLVGGVDERRRQVAEDGLELAVPRRAEAVRGAALPERAVDLGPQRGDELVHLGAAPLEAGSHAVQLVDLTTDHRHVR